MIRFAPEGYPFILGSFLLAVIASVFLIWALRTGSHGITFYSTLSAFCIFFLGTFFMAYFFRDPERAIPQGKSVFVSPADGKVILIREVFEPEYLHAEAKEISIFMSPLDVHVNRAPCDGRVIAVRYSPGKYMAAYRDEASLQNENIVMHLAGDDGQVLVRQVAGFVARRAVCRAKEGDLLARGERYGIIKFSSRLDVYLPKDVVLKVKTGDRVKAGESVIAVKN
ncbi:MAG: phosphatidylserine decarboxylase family protein [Nitrospirota bacterium]